MYINKMCGHVTRGHGHSWFMLSWLADVASTKTFISPSLFCQDLATLYHSHLEYTYSKKLFAQVKHCCLSGAHDVVCTVIQKILLRILCVCNTNTVFCWWTGGKWFDSCELLCPFLRAVCDLRGNIVTVWWSHANCTVGGYSYFVLSGKLRAVWPVVHVHDFQNI